MFLNCKFIRCYIKSMFDYFLGMQKAPFKNGIIAKHLLVRSENKQMNNSNSSSVFTRRAAAGWVFVFFSISCSQLRSCHQLSAYEESQVSSSVSSCSQRPDEEALCVTLRAASLRDGSELIDEWNPPQTAGNSNQHHYIVQKEQSLQV